MPLRRRSCVKCNYSRKEEKYTVYFFFSCLELSASSIYLYLNAFLRGFTVISFIFIFVKKKKCYYIGLFIGIKKNIYKKKDPLIYLQTLHTSSSIYVVNTQKRYTNVHTHTHIRTYTRKHMYIYTYVHTYIHTYIHIYICILTYNTYTYPWMKL